MDYHELTVVFENLEAFKTNNPGAKVSVNFSIELGPESVTVTDPPETIAVSSPPESYSCESSSTGREELPPTRDIFRGNRSVNRPILEKLRSTRTLLSWRQVYDSAYQDGRADKKAWIKLDGQIRRLNDRLLELGLPWTVEKYGTNLEDYQFRLEHYGKAISTD